MIININTIYIDSKFKIVKFSYIPDNHKVSIDKKLILLIEELKKITTDEGACYLNKLSLLIRSKEISYLRLKYFLNKLLQEINNC